MKKKSLLIISYVNLHNKMVYPIFTEATKLVEHFTILFDKIDILCQPMIGESHKKTFIYSDFKKNKIKFSIAKRKLNYVNKTSILLKIRDFISTFMHLLKNDYDLIIAVESINCISALLIKALFKKKIKILYFCNDYHPNRYGYTMTKIYNYLDKICSYNADYNWLMNMEIVKLRNKLGINNIFVKNMHDISGGIAMKYFPYKRRVIKSNLRLIYAARNHEYGLKLALNLAIKIAEKSHLNIILIITGKNQTIPINISKKIIKLINLQVKFTGFIEVDELDNYIYNSDIGLAFYPDQTLSSSEYGDPEKIRRYVNAGLPLVVSGKGKTVEMVEKENIGIHVSYNIKSIFKGINYLINNHKNYLILSNNSFKLGNKHRKSDNVFNSLASISTQL